MQENETVQNSAGDQRQWHAAVVCICVCVCALIQPYVCVCLTANEKEREKIWWIVSYMETISSPVIYGVNNGVYSEACSPVVFLFVVGWQKYYSQTAHLLNPILIQNPINSVLTRICTIWHYGQNRVCVRALHSNDSSVCICTHCISKTNTVTNTTMYFNKIQKDGEKNYFLKMQKWRMHGLETLSMQYWHMQWLL